MALGINFDNDAIGSAPVDWSCGVTGSGSARWAVTADPSALKERSQLLKRMSVIKRLPTLNEDDFRKEWKTHGDLVRKMSGVSAYRQNVITGRERVKGYPCGYSDLPIDGIVELWFKDAETLNAAFGSEAGQETMAHAKTFLSEITAFVVAERQIV